MKKRVLIFMACFVAVFLAFMACQDESFIAPRGKPDFRNPASLPPELRQAMEWYRGNSYQIFELPTKNGGRHALFDEMEPNWEQCFIRSNQQYISVEMTLKTLTSKIFILPQNNEMYRATGEKRYRQSITRLVILTNRTTKDTIGFFMSILPDPDYLERTNFQPYYHSYLEGNNEFSGTILYHDLDGTQANGWIYDNGKVIAMIPRSAHEHQVQTKGYVYQTYCTETFDLVCQYWHVVAEAQGVIVNEYDEYSCKSQAGLPACWEEPVYVPDPDIGGGGGSYYPPEDSQSCKGEKCPKCGKYIPELSHLSSHCPRCTCPLCPICNTRNCNKIHNDCSDDVNIRNKELTNLYYGTMDTIQGFTYGSRYYPSFNDYIQTIARDSNTEHSVSMKFYADEKTYRLDKIETGTNKNVSIWGSSPGVVASIHSHPANNPSLPSAQDLITAATCAKENKDFKFLYTYVKGDIYAFYIDDRTKAINFVNNNAKCVDTTSNMFLQGTITERDWADGMKKFVNLPLVHQLEHAMIYTLDKQNSGIMFLKKDKNKTGFSALSNKEINNYYVPTKCD